MSSQEDFQPAGSGDTEYEVHSVFPTPIYIREKIDITEFAIPLSEVANIPRSPTFDSNSLYGDRSENTYVLDNPSLKIFKEKIATYVNEYANLILGMAGEYAITQSWLSVKTPGQRHIMHSHANSIISGVFYFNNNEETEGLTFIKTDVANTWQMVPLKNPNINNQFSFNEITLKVENNMLCLFPSYLAHKVQGNSTTHDRYSIAFNAVPKFGLGYEHELTELEFRRVGRE